MTRNTIVRAAATLALCAASAVVLAGTASATGCVTDGHAGVSTAHEIDLPVGSDPNEIDLP